MQAVGIIVEYNPFHNGHAYHLEQAKKQTESDCVIAVMSGHFLQRGEPALVSKWSRTKMALDAGADLVIELPYSFSTQKADTFASGAVSILDQLEVHSLCFGSEHGNIESFLDIIKLLEIHEQELSLQIQHEIKKGNSYPKAVSLALSHIISEPVALNLTQPNNILGLSYVKAIKKQLASIKPHTITRIQSHYHDEELSSSSITSATSIRHALFQSSLDVNELANYMPQHVLTSLMDYKKTFGTFHTWEHYFPFLKYRLMTMSPASLQEIYEIEEGIEYRLLSSIKEATSFEDFINKVKTKRYTRTRLQRMCVHILTDTSKEQMQPDQSSCSYIRLLGMSAIGRKYINHIKKRSSVPIVSTVSQYKLEDLLIDVKATDVYSLALNEPIRSTFLKQEYTLPPIMK
ncbi:nucleotidyltransferase [Priestia megaterium]|nr:nucleotidyltransferase [Priestia megaterium]